MANLETGHATYIANFKLLINQCTDFGPMYNPDNPVLAIENMTGHWTVGNTSHNIARDMALYAETTGMVVAALNCKNYVKAVFVPFSPQAKVVGRIKFRRRYPFYAKNNESHPLFLGMAFCFYLCQQGKGWKEYY